MAQTLERALNVKNKALGDTRKASSQSVLRTLFGYLAQHKPNTDLQIVPLSGMETADVVASDVAARLYAVLVKKPTASTVDSWVKASDHASAAAANGDWVTKLKGTAGGGQEVCAVYPDGLMFPTGITFGAHTTVNGAGKSLVADAAVGFAIVGPA